MVDVIHANMMNRLYGFERLWDVFAEHGGEQVGVDTKTAQPVTWSDMAKQVQKFLAWESGDYGSAKVYDAVETGLLECIKLGTVVWYTPWITNTRRNYTVDDNGNVRSGEAVTDFDGAMVKTIPLEDFLIMPFYSEIHGPDASPLVGHSELLRPGQVAQMVYDGKYLPEMKDALTFGIGGEKASASQRMKDHQSAQEGDGATVLEDRGDDLRMYKLHLEVDINGDGREESVYVEYHKDSSTIARITPYPYKTRPYDASRYVRREHRFYGIGVPEMMESIQRGINTSVNQAIDNATLANTRVLAARRKSAAAKSLDSWYPGKKVVFDSTDDLKPFQLGEVYPSVFEIGRVLQALGERRTGVSDYNLGRETGGSTGQGTATSTMALLQEASRRFDLYAKDIRRSLGEIGIQLLERFQQFKPVGRYYSVLGEKGALVEQPLSLPMAINIRQHLRVRTTSSASSANKEVARQNAIGAFGVLTQYFERVFELSQVLISPTAPESLKQLAYQMSEVGERLMGKVLEGFDMEDVAAFLPQLEGVLKDGQQQLGAGGQGAGGPVGPDQDPGVAGGGGVGPAPGPPVPPTVRG